MLSGALAIGCRAGLGPGQWVDVPRAAGPPVAYRYLGPPGSADGVVILIGLPGQARLPQRLVERGMAAVVPALDRESMFLRPNVMDQIRDIVEDAQRRTGAPPGVVAIGGISLGGTAAVRYAEHCASGRCDSAATPRAVFAVDAPLDMERLWRSATVILGRGAPESNLQETQWLLDRLTNVLGGPPDIARASYAAYSPFLYFARDGGNARLLLRTPLRLYTEPDIDYWVEQRRYDYYNTNAFDAAGLTNRLLLSGHEDVALITTSGQGFRPDGTRNPHSWSIVDEDDLVRWITDRLSRTPIRATP